MYKFLHSGYPKHFEPLLKPRHSVYRSQSDGVLLEVPHFASIYKSKKVILTSALHMMLQGLFDLPDDVRSHGEKYLRYSLKYDKICFYLMGHFDGS